MVQKELNEAVILLIEDNRLDLELTLNAFEDAGLSSDIHVVRNGRMALDYLLGHEKYSNRDVYPIPDLILLDLKLPGIDGHQVLQEIKRTPSIKRIPVIVLTSSQEPQDLLRCYDNYTNSYLVKPVNFEGFLKIISLIDEYWLTWNISPPEPFEVS